MKIHILLLTATLLTACSKAPDEVVDTGQRGAEPMQMADGVGASADDAATTTKASATGTIEAIDAAAGKITIAHEPVPSLQWPAMTMGFRATPEQIASVQVGQTVRFDFESKGMDAAITQIVPVE
ncbi:copper-binding protein [Iodidimonas sp. MBR-14]|uniref:copper-binding protein n=1 Tax=Iodidimonas sp. MBR-14 TaxID=3032319 RepID=UPI0024825A89|nr:copper-binding protein [Iodidimonas sp. MBR-14]